MKKIFALIMMIAVMAAVFVGCSYVEKPMVSPVDGLIPSVENDTTDVTTPAISTETEEPATTEEWRGEATEVTDVTIEVETSKEAATTPASGEPTEPAPSEPAHKHDFKPSKVVPPTCSTKGYTIYTCSCKKSENRDYTDVIAHTYGDGKVVAATCTAQGYTQYTCTRCGNSFKQNFTKALGHSFSLTKTIEPTTSAEGYDLYTCSRCGATEKRNVKPKIEKPVETVDVQAATAYGNSYGQSLGFILDTSLGFGNAGYYPGDNISATSTDNLKKFVAENVQDTYNCLMLRDGSIEGYRVNVYIETRGVGNYCIWVFYG